jgi:two-component system heavy metal sensor histidine kinase CusS
MTRKLFNAISFRIAIIFSLSTVIILIDYGAGHSSTRNASF